MVVNQSRSNQSRLLSTKKNSNITSALHLYFLVMASVTSAWGYCMSFLIGSLRLPYYSPKICKHPWSILNTVACGMLLKIISTLLITLLIFY